ncbi:radical SAM protein [Citrifermentans bremense]|uniref:radical SAM protein n=1 Tax=Citrifermentans bremense TaxID=60035 RepID=UPI00041076AB|nr:radical SAM protein [Citrifermentans bremense]
MVRTLRPFARQKYNVLIDTTNGCNLRCSFCSRENDKVVCMPPGQLDLILGKLDKRISALQLSCAWEYSIAKDAAEIVRTVGRHGIPCTAIYTNGNILTGEIAAALIDAQLNDFVVSIGEAGKETYEKLRKGGSFDKVLANLKMLSELKQARGSRYPRISANLTLVESNLCELPAFVELARSVGIENIVGRHLILNKGLDLSDESVRDKRAANRIIDAAEEKARSFGMEFSVPRYLDAPQPKSCRAAWQQLYISSNGDVSACPRIHLHAKLGNLLEESRARILKGPRAKRLQGEFQTGSFENPVCPVCLAGRENEQPIDQGF